MEFASRRKRRSGDGMEEDDMGVCMVRYDVRH